ncbi:MAG: MFS transporter [Chloroflexi bacterium]|nr:MFS transporter [Chloroflexota bacterium]
MARRFTGLWRDRDFLRFWAAHSISLVGTGLGALPFTAILVLDAGPLEMALVTAASLAPALVFGLAAGVWVDRLRRRPILIAADLGRGAMLAGVVLAWWLDALRIEHLYAVALVNGALATFFDVAAQAYIPALVAKDDLVEANSKLSASASAAELGSFSLGGVIVQVAGAMWAVGADAVSFLGSALFVARIRHPEPAPENTGGEQHALKEVAEGLRAIARDPIQRSLAVASASRHLTYGMVGAVILLYGTRTLGLAPGALGVIFGVGGATSLAGALLADRLTRRVGVGPAMVGAMFAGALGGLFIVAAQGGAWLAALFLVLSQLVVDPATAVEDIGENSIRQGVTPERLRGRVGAGVRTLSLSLELCGALAAGLIAQSAGLRVALAIGLAPRLAGALWLLASPVMRIRAPGEPITA